jgi:hypothetical protein
MANRLINQSIDFIDENPAIAAYQKAQKFDQDQRSGELDIEGKQRTNNFNRAADPNRLRKLGAETTSAEGDAAVNTGTVDSRIANSAAGASLANTNASTAAAEAPFKIDQTESGARTARAGADVASATVPVKIEEEGTRLRQQRATAVNTEMQGFYKSLDLLNSGDVEGAKAAAEAVGHPLPDVVVNDNRVRDVVTTAAKRAKELYPDRPANQQAYIEAQLGEVKQRIASGQPPDRYTSYTMPSGAPAPVESNATSSYEMLPATRANPQTGQPEQGYLHHDRKSGETEFVSGTTISSRNGGAGRDSVFQQRLKVGNSLYGEGSKEAADYANGRRQVTPGEAMRFGMQQAETELRNDPTISNKFKGAADRTNWKNNRAKEIATTISQSQTVAPPAAPAAPTSGSGLPPQASISGPTQVITTPTDLAGVGTKASPWVATTQDHINWFKQNGKPGDVIMVNGQAYTLQ